MKYASVMICSTDNCCNTMRGTRGAGTRPRITGRDARARPPPRMRALQAECGSVVSCASGVKWIVLPIEPIARCSDLEAYDRQAYDPENPENPDDPDPFAEWPFEE